MKRNKPITLILLALGSCVAPAGDGERLTYQAVAPEYIRYVDADPALAQDAKERRRLTVETWRLRVEAGNGK